MSSLYKQYIEERESKTVLEESYGFVIYEIKQDYIYIQDVYILPDFRGGRKAAQLVDKVLADNKTEDIKKLITSTDLNAKNVEHSILAIIRYGFKPYMNEESMTYYVKEI